VTEFILIFVVLTQLLTPAPRPRADLGNPECPPCTGPR
jgi:hypothetical protein